MKLLRASRYHHAMHDMTGQPLWDHISYYWQNLPRAGHPDFPDAKFGRSYVDDQGRRVSVWLERIRPGRRPCPRCRCPFHKGDPVEMGITTRDYRSGYVVEVRRDGVVRVMWEGDRERSHYPLDLRPYDAAFRRWIETGCRS